MFRLFGSCHKKNIYLKTFRLRVSAGLRKVSLNLSAGRFLGLELGV